MNLRDIANKINRINPRDLMNEIAIGLSYEFIELNKEQLMEGKSSEGVNLRPYYSEDTYFKSSIAAKRYIKWKQKITPNPKRYSDAPNLYITGKFHAGFYALALGYDFEIDSRDNLTSKIKSKYNHVFGLSPQNIEVEKNKILKLSWRKIINLLSN